MGHLRAGRVLLIGCAFVPTQRGGHCRSIRLHSTKTSPSPQGSARPARAACRSHAQLAGAAVVVTICSASTASADECPGGAYGYVVTVQGAVERNVAGSGSWQPAQLNTPVCKGDVIRVGEKSRAGIYFDDTETVAYVDQNTITGVAAQPTERSLMLDLLKVPQFS